MPKDNPCTLHPRIKICGITNFEDAKASAELGAHYLGLNFFPESPRFLDSDEAIKLADIIKNELDVKLVGVFVNEKLETIKRIADVCSLDIIQLHGNETPDFCASFDLPVWKAFRVQDENSLTDVTQFIQLEGIVLDAYRKGEFGGTGQTFNWQLIHHVRDELPFFILSGGLNSSNVAKAIKQLKPNVLDICSGVEISENPRRKNSEKLQKLCSIIKELSA